MLSKDLLFLMLPQYTTSEFQSSDVIILHMHVQQGVKQLGLCLLLLCPQKANNSMAS